MREGWKDTELGLIPVDWEQSILSEYAEKPQYGFTDSSSNSGNAKFLRITDITDTGVNWNDVPYCNCPDVDKYKLVDGDIVFARIGATTGKSYIIKNPPKAVFASYLIRVRTRSKLLSDYLIYFFNSEYYWEQINSQKGNNLKGGVNGSILSDLKIIVPPTPEQRKIAYVLSTVQKAIEQQDKLIRHSTELKKALMQKLFTEGIGWLSGAETRQKQTEIGLVPESWEVKGFDELFDIVKSQSHSRTKLTYGETQSMVLNIHYGDIHSSFRSEILDVETETLPFIIDEYNNEAKNNYLKEGDIVIADASEDLIDIGKCIELRNVGKKKVIGGLHTIVARPKAGNIVKGFGAFVFKHKHVADEIRYIATGLSVYGISKGNLLKMLIPIPPIKEQEVMAKTIININAKLEIQKKKKQTLSVLFKTLLHELMTGERRVHEIEFEKVSEPLMMND